MSPEAPRLTSHASVEEVTVMPKVELKTGIRMYYEEYGSGEPLLLVMGTGGDHNLWAQQIPVFGKEFRCIALHNRGMGETDKPNTRYTIRLMSEDAVALFDTLSVDQAHIAGLSIGSCICQEIALNHPSRVKSLSLYHTWARTDDFLRLMFDILAYPLRRGDIEFFIRTLAPYLLMSRRYITERPDAVEAFANFYLKHPTPPEMILKHYQADVEHDALDRLPEITCPTLVLTGEEDICVPPRYSEEVHKLIPDSEYAIITGPGSSHLQLMERPADFNRVALDFLRRAVDR